MPPVTLTINDQSHIVDADPNMPVLWVLRDVLGLTGTKYGCGEGLCGACTVLVDGMATRSCLFPLSAAVEHKLTTIEGLSAHGDHPVQLAWLAEAVSQCGYCQAGQVLTAAALLARTPQPSEAEIEAAFADMLCRCGTYQRIRRAVRRAAQG